MREVKISSQVCKVFRGNAKRSERILTFLLKTENREERETGKGNSDKSFCIPTSDSFSKVDNIAEEVEEVKEVDC